MQHNERIFTVARAGCGWTPVSEQLHCDSVSADVKLTRAADVKLAHL